MDMGHVILGVGMIVTLVGADNIRRTVIGWWQGWKAWWGGRDARRETRKAENMEKSRLQRFAACERDHDNLHGAVGMLVCPDCGYQVSCDCANMPTKWIIPHSYPRDGMVEHFERKVSQHTCGKIAHGYAGTCMLCGRRHRFVSEMSLTAWEDNAAIPRLGLGDPLHVCVDRENCDAYFADMYRDPRRLIGEMADRAKTEVEERQRTWLQNWKVTVMQPYLDAACRLGVQNE